MPAITIKKESPFVEELFARYETLIGTDFPSYRNHVYRTITYAMHFLGNNEECERLVEATFVYHDIGLWTDQALAYLEPSEAVALADNKKFGLGLDPDLLRGAIHWHHKIFSLHWNTQGNHRSLPQGRLDRCFERHTSQGH